MLTLCGPCAARGKILASFSGKECPQPHRLNFLHFFSLPSFVPRAAPPVDPPLLCSSGAIFVVIAALGDVRQLQRIPYFPGFLCSSGGIFVVIAALGDVRRLQRKPSLPGFLRFSRVIPVVIAALGDLRQLQ